MDSEADKKRVRKSRPQRRVIAGLRKALRNGQDWPTALLEAMAAWTVPEESVRGRRRVYLIEGEAFDWLALAERLCEAAGDQIPGQETEDLLFSGRFPDYIDTDRFQTLLGPDKYSRYLNYFYGVTVEEALQLAVERDFLKRHLSNGRRYREDFTDEVHTRIYRAPKSELLRSFREEKEYRSSSSMSLTEHKEFTYWLFKHRLRTSDKARVASDTNKGLKHLQRMAPDLAPTMAAHPAAGAGYGRQDMANPGPGTGQ